MKKEDRNVGEEEHPWSQIGGPSFLRSYLLTPRLNLCCPGTQTCNVLFVQTLDKTGYDVDTQPMESLVGSACFIKFSLSRYIYLIRA